MLVLSRKLGEELVIGDNIRLRVVAIRGKRVRLGLTAPAEMPIRREEFGSLPDSSRELESPPTARTSECVCGVGPAERLRWTRPRRS